tara:strand:- start:12074 stop:12994 length:921 start_codon:yes stop_codon:yes gene_type:complete
MTKNRNNMSDKNPFISIIGPAHNEEGTIISYVEECIEALNYTNFSYEIILINDGSNDKTKEVMKEIKNRYPSLIRIINFRFNKGLTQALKAGFESSSGDFIIWLCTDLECSPTNDIPKLIDPLLNGYDVVAGERIGRNDGKVFTSFIYNFVSFLLFGTQGKDLNWVKSFKRECLNSLTLRSDWHRFIIHMLQKDRWNIKYVDLPWRKRISGKSKYGFKRIITSLLDVIALYFLLKARESPLRSFGMMAFLIFIVATIIQIFLLGLYISLAWQIRPLFLLSIALDIFSLQLFIFGLLGELIADNNKN